MTPFYTEAIRLNPDYPIAYSSRGSSYDKMGNYAQAIADYTEAIRLDPDDAFAYFGRASTYKHQGDLIAARTDAEQAIKLYAAQGRHTEVEWVRTWLNDLDQ